jgi:glucokinase
MSVAIGVDLGGTNCRAALVEIAGGRILDEEKRPVVDRAPGRVADLAAAIVNRLDPSGARSVGVGFAGMLRGFAGVVANAPNYGWRDVDLARLLVERMPGRTARLYNDLNAIAYGEHRYGAGRGAGDLLCVYLGTGVGGGMVLDGRLYLGSDNLAGEIGHVKVVPGGRRCGCGQLGCIEAYVSGRNLAERARDELSRPGAPPSLALTLAGDAARIHAGHIDEAARRGDAWAGALWDEVAPMLGLVLANAVTILNPSRLVLGGGVWDGAPDLRRRATVAFRALVNAPSGDAVTLLDTALGDGAGMLGAAALVAEGASG